MISAKSGVRIFSLTYVTYCSGRLLIFYIMPHYAQKKTVWVCGQTDYTESGSPTKDSEMNLIVLSSRPTTGSLEASTLFLVHRGSPKYCILKFVKGGGEFLNHHSRVADGPITFTTTPDPLLHASMCFLGGYKITFCINVFLSDEVFQSRSWFPKNEYCFTLISAQS